ncbi:DUF6146 family protein [Geofilum rubicundum]|uniref:Lipoprotein n=1 Tax=Geofilum rubicundum JCM 15548 TaxID=1236989 RepID=A0A0E9LUW1_9BACT|nr:DUF6146 family protein [Geofilum rubicundum]GAO29093.1 hypothetical protein JCM15548_11250 [Geofilum rubicundum JCM 15548]
MKHILIVLMALGMVTACGVSRQSVADAPEQGLELVADDSLEYELVVLDPGFTSFLATQPPAEHYSQSYYEGWNHRYVLEWNSRHRHPLRYGDFYQTEIQYDPHTDYGLELNYQLYYYFQFIEQEYGIELIRRR